MKRLKQINLRMKTFAIIKIALLLMLFSNNVSLLNAQIKNYGGTDFVLSFAAIAPVPLSNSNYYTFTFMFGITTGDEAANVTVTLNGSSANPGNVLNHVVAANSAITQQIALGAMKDCYNDEEGVTNRSIRIRSDVPITVCAGTYFGGNGQMTNIYPRLADMTNILPVSVLGNEYYHLGGYGANQDQYMVIATQDNTMIYEDGVLVETLSENQVLLRQAPSGSPVGFNGLRITSNNPFAYFSAHNNFSLQGEGENIFQQLAPVQTWGKEFIVPVTRRGLELVRIIASQNGTTITQTGARQVSYGNSNPPAAPATVTLNAGEWVEWRVQLSDNGCHIIANKPVQVASYMVGGDYANATIANGDGGFVNISPIEQTTKSAQIIPYNIIGTTAANHSILIVTPTATKNNTTISTGGAPPVPLSGGIWHDNPSSGMSFYNMEIPFAYQRHLIENEENVTVYGYGFNYNYNISYYYMAATPLRRLDAAFYINDIHNQDADGMSFCNTSFNIMANIEFGMNINPGRLKWYINGVERLEARDQLTWSTSLPDGTHKIKMVALSNDDRVFEIESTITVSSMTPGTIGGNQTLYSSGIPAPLTSTTAASGGAGTLTYQWQQSTNGTTWNAAPGANTGLNYTPTTAITNTTYYRRRVTSDCGAGYSNTVTVELSEGPPTTLGKEFWVSWGQNAHVTASSLTFQVRIVATKATSVTLSFTENNSLNQTFNLTAGQVYTHNLTSAQKNAVFNLDMSYTNNKSLYITSDEDVSVYAINLLGASTDATNVLPVKSYGTEYYILTYTTGEGYIIIASEPGITNVRNHLGVNIPLTQGQVYHRYYAYESDLTGRKVTSDKPVAMFAANPQTQVPSNINASDCLYQQLAPTHLWGKVFMVPVSSGTSNNITRNRDRIRIVASQDGTTITQTGGTVKNIGSASTLAVNTLNNPLNAGQWVELEIHLDDHGCYITADKPIAIMSFLMGSRNFNSGGGLGDPAMAWIPPVEQSVTNTTIAPFFAEESSVLLDNQHYALIVAPTATKDNTTVAIGASGTSQPLSGGIWRDNLASGYSFYTYNFSATNKNDAYFFENPAGLTILAYGLGTNESYYYLAASALRNLAASFYINDIHYQDADGTSFCNSAYDIRANIEFGMNINPGRLKWYINGVERLEARDQLTWSTPLPDGTHKIKMVALSSDDRVFEIESTITVNSMMPGTIGSNQTLYSSGIPAPLTSITPATGGSSITYQWQQSTNGTTWNASPGANTGLNYTPTTAITNTTYYRRRVTSDCGTGYSDTVTVTIAPALAAGTIGSNRTICSGDLPGELTSITAASGGAGAITYQWQQHDGTSWVSVTGGSGATTVAYTPPVLTATTRYRRNATNNSGTVSSNEVTVTVTPLSTPAMIKVTAQ